MEPLLLPAFRLHMDNCSFTNEQWPEEKQPLPFPAVLPRSLHPSRNRARIIYSLRFSVGVWVLELKKQNGFFGLKSCGLSAAAEESH